MKETIYINLLEEGTTVYRPVEAIKLDDNIYQILGEDIYCPEDETWEFLPGEIVKAEYRKLSDGLFLVAIKNVNL